MIIALTNYDEPIAEIVAKQIYTTLKNGTYEPPRPPVFQLLYRAYREHGGDYLQGHFQEIIAGYPLLDPPDFLLKRVGYDLLNENDIDAAIDIFAINTRLFPEVANTWDSLGETYLRKGNREPAIRNYCKSLELDPNNRNAAQMLKQLEAGGRE